MSRINKIYYNKKTQDKFLRLTSRSYKRKSLTLKPLMHPMKHSDYIKYSIIEDNINRERDLQGNIYELQLFTLILIISTFILISLSSAILPPFILFVCFMLAINKVNVLNNDTEIKLQS